MARKLGGKRGVPNRDPLRKIVERFHEHVGITDDGIDVMVPRERLECGHVVRIKQDIFGETNASSRRCAACRKEQEAA